jgi:hypothetical protein
LVRKRFPGTGEGASRWCVRQGDVPKGMEAVILLSIEEIAVNELRETFHHWVRTIAFPVTKSTLGDPLPHRPVAEWRGGSNVTDPHIIDTMRELMDDVQQNIKKWLKTHTGQISDDLKLKLDELKKDALKHEDQRYRSRLAEVSSLISSLSIEKLNKEIATLRLERQQGLLFAQEEQFDRIDRSIEQKEEELARQKFQHEEVRKQLNRERERIMNHQVPKRHAMAGTAHVFPIAIEIRIPA